MEATRLHQVADTIKAVFAPNDAFLLIRLDTAVSTACCRVLEVFTASHPPGMTLGRWTLRLALGHTLGPAAWQRWR